jgi:protein-S-isoprenylcysteine O-methyltransferase Ste14
MWRLRNGASNMNSTFFVNEDMKANLIALAVALAVLALLVAHFGGQPWTPMRIAGAAIGGPSLALLILARIQLGGSFSVRAKAQALVTGGLYSRIRNPIYVFGALTIAGIFLFAGAPKLLWVLAALIPLQIYRARNEEKVLAAKFGDEYRAYKARTWF